MLVLPKLEAAAIYAIRYIYGYFNSMHHKPNEKRVKTTVTHFSIMFLQMPMHTGCFLKKKNISALDQWPIR